MFLRQVLCGKVFTFLCLRDYRLNYQSEFDLVVLTYTLSLEVKGQSFISKLLY